MRAALLDAKIAAAQARAREQRLVPLTADLWRALRHAAKRAADLGFMPATTTLSPARQQAKAFRAAQALESPRQWRRARKAMQRAARDEAWRAQAVGVLAP